MNVVEDEPFLESVSCVPRVAEAALMLLSSVGEALYGRRISTILHALWHHGRMGL